MRRDLWLELPGSAPGWTAWLSAPWSTARLRISSPPVSAVSAMIRVVCAASRRGAGGRASHNPPVMGSSPTRSAREASLHLLPVRPDLPVQLIRGGCGQHLSGAADRRPGPVVDAEGVVAAFGPGVFQCG